MQPPVYPQQPPGNYQMPQQAGWGQQPAWGQQPGPNPYQMPQQQGGYGTQPPTRQGSSTGILLLGILVFIVLAGAALGIITKGNFSSIIPSNSTDTSSTNEPTSPTPETQSPAPVEKIQVTAKELAAAFAADKTAAEKQYKGKIVRVSGVVVGVDIGTPYVTLTSGDANESGARCIFTSSVSSAIGDLETGQSVTIEGKVTGYNDADVIVENCSFIT